MSSFVSPSRVGFQAPGFRALFGQLHPGISGSKVTESEHGGTCSFLYPLLLSAKVVAMTVSRRTFLVRSGQAVGLIAASGGLGAMLEAAASPAGASPATALTPVTYQLGWLANVENAGEFVADTRGYFADEGIKITLVPGGPTTTVEPLVLAGRCLVGLSETDTTAQAITQGGKLKTIGATLQVTPLAVASLASKPIDTPFDLYGKKFGVQAFQDQVVDAFFKTIGVDKSKITIVPASGDPSILPAGEVDALFVLLDNEPITLALQGVKTHTFTLDQYGWNVFGDTLEVADASLANAKTRDIIVHVVRAVVRGVAECPLESQPGGQHGREQLWQEPKAELEAAIAGARGAEERDCNSVHKSTWFAQDESFRHRGQPQVDPFRGHQGSHRIDAVRHDRHRGCL